MCYSLDFCADFYRNAINIGLAIVEALKRPRVSVKAMKSRSILMPEQS